MNRSTSNLIKIIAMLTMLIDHIGAVLFPHLLYLRIIGRIAFPLFAFLLVMGFKHTRNLNRYLFRLLIFGLISQVPYHFLAPGRINVILYFFVALLSLALYNKHKNHIYIPVLAGIITESLNMSYGAYGIIAIYIFYFLYDRKIHLSIAFILLNLLYLGAYSNYIQPLSIMSLPFLFINLKSIDIKMNKYIAYLFYPVHISVILLIKYYGLS